MGLSLACGSRLCRSTFCTWSAVGSVVDGPPFPFQWLNGERVIQRLVELIHPSQDEDVSMALAHHRMRKRWLELCTALSRCL